jgi:hypothetical protein
MSPKLTQLIEQSAALSPQERLELATHLKSSQDSLDRWDLSEASIAKRNAEMRQVLAEWRETGDELEQTETWEELKVSLDRDRLSSNRPFFPAE